LNSNVAAAAFLLKRKMPALYRVHQGPTEDRLDDLRSFLALRGLEIGGGDKPDTADFAKLAALADDLPDARVIHRYVAILIYWFTALLRMQLRMEKRLIIP